MPVSTITLLNTAVSLVSRMLMPIELDRKIVALHTVARSLFRRLIPVKHPLTIRFSARISRAALDHQSGHIAVEAQATDCKVLASGHLEGRLARAPDRQVRDAHPSTVAELDADCLTTRVDHRGVESRSLQADTWGHEQVTELVRA